MNNEELISKYVEWVTSKIRTNLGGQNIIKDDCYEGFIELATDCATEILFNKEYPLYIRKDAVLPESLTSHIPLLGAMLDELGYLPVIPLTDTTEEEEKC